jgi:hypothetical protein
MKNFSLLVGAVVLLCPTGQSRAADQRPVTCTFTNQTYSGECVEKTSAPKDVTPSAACQPILDCLNNVQCTMYCGHTSTRSGWALKSATEGSKSQKSGN